ncbi:hypothetical protein AB0425_04895 [Actinosynnema sp. NPDC051121]
MEPDLTAAVLTAVPGPPLLDQRRAGTAERPSPHDRPRALA